MVATKGPGSVQVPAPTAPVPVRASSMSKAAMFLIAFGVSLVVAVVTTVVGIVIYKKMDEKNDVTPTPTPAPTPAPKLWSYVASNPDVYGPAQWGTLYPACNGNRQSPIDITDSSKAGTVTVASGAPLAFAGTCKKHHVKEVYDSFKAAAEEDGTCATTALGKEYKYAQSHFHIPSEHTLNGKYFDAEVHFVHAASDGLLVVGMFLSVKSGATTDPYFTDVWSEMEKANGTVYAEAEISPFYPLIQTAMGAGKLFNYAGSLTAPTCNETVDWWVAEKPVEVAPDDFTLLQTALKRVKAADNGLTSRPVQGLHGRHVYVY